MKCYPNGFTLPPSVNNMWDLYKEYWLPFGQLLTDMEAVGVLVNREHLATGEVRSLISSWRPSSLCLRDFGCGLFALPNNSRPAYCYTNRMRKVIHIGQLA
jgi:hypothetical protein